MQKKTAHLLNALMLLFSLSCATATGPLFREIPPEGQKGRAVVYFYRNSHTGGASVYELVISGNVTLPLLNKGYLPLVFEPGAYEFKIFFDSKVLKAENKFDFQADETYFIRYWSETVGYEYGPIFVPVPGGSGRRPIVNEGITLVSKEEALEVLKKCRLIEVTRMPEGTAGVPIFSPTPQTP